MEKNISYESLHHFTFFSRHLVQLHIQKHTSDDIGLQQMILDTADDIGLQLDWFWSQSQLLLCFSLPLELFTHTHTRTHALI